MPSIALDNLPRHVAIIMDGNGRWAARQGDLRTVGHREGSHAVRRIVRACRRLGVEALTLYAFSAQNWSRPRMEVDALMALLCDYLASERAELLEQGIRLRAVGRRENLPHEVLSLLEPLERETADLSGMTLTLALSYGGREELIDACRELATRVRDGSLDPSAIDEATLAGAQPSMDVGPVDLLVRTGGEVRVSNFLLWGAAYAELYFADTLWPDFGERELFEAIAAYQGRERRFGGLLDAPAQGAA